METPPPPDLKLYLLLDFDCTITTCHGYYFLNDIRTFLSLLPSETIFDPDEVRELSKKARKLQSLALEDVQQLRTLLFGSEERLASLRSWLERFQKEFGMELRIVSHGYQDQIRWLLQQAELDTFFPLDASIVGRGTPKEEFIGSLLEHGNKVIYVDDDSREHDQILQRGKQEDWWALRYHGGTLPGPVIFMNNEGFYYYHPLPYQGSGIQSQDWEHVLGVVSILTLKRKNPLTS